MPIGLNLGADNLALGYGQRQRAHLAVLLIRFVQQLPRSRKSDFSFFFKPDGSAELGNEHGYEKQGCNNDYRGFPVTHARKKMPRVGRKPPRSHTYVAYGLHAIMHGNKRAANVLIMRQKQDRLVPDFTPTSSACC